MNLSKAVCLLVILAAFFVASMYAIDSYSIDANSPEIKYSNARYVVKGSQVWFDWPGLRINTHVYYREENNVHPDAPHLNHLQLNVDIVDEKNMYNAHLYKVHRISLRRLELLQSIFVNAADPRNEMGEMSVSFVWKKPSPIPEDYENEYIVEIELEKRTEAQLGIVKLNALNFIGGSPIPELEEEEDFPHNQTAYDEDDMMDHPLEELVVVRKSREDPVKVDPPKPFAIEFIGDSYSCGWGNLGFPPCDYEPRTQNIHEAFTQKTARYLNATQLQVNCWSGKGVVKNYDDTTPTSKNPFPVYYSRALANDPEEEWHFEKSSFVPDVLVITLGTNDFCTQQVPSFKEFKAGYQKFIDFIMETYLPLKGENFKMVLVVSIVFILISPN